MPKESKIKGRGGEANDGFLEIRRDDGLGRRIWSFSHHFLAGNFNRFNSIGSLAVETNTKEVVEEVRKMLNAKAFANAASAVMVIWVVACSLLSYVAPDLLFSIAQSWMHTVNLESVKATFAPNLGSLLLGLVSAVGLTWVTTYGTITLYNKWAK